MHIYRQSKIVALIISFLLAFLCIYSTHNASAQKKEKAPDLFTIPTKDKVYIFIREFPRAALGFNIYRKSIKDKEPIKLNTEGLIAPVEDPLIFREILGPDYEWVEGAVRAENEFRCLRRLKADPGIGFALSLAIPKVATALARLYLDSDVKEGEEYTYKIAFVDYKGNETKTVEEKVLVKAHKPPALLPQKLTAKAGDGEVKLTWEYPEWKGEKEDIVIGFHIYRKKAPDKKFTKLTKHPLLRWSKELFYTDKAVENGVEYNYCVTAVDIIEAQSHVSNIVSAKPMDTTPPLIPTGLETISEEGKITIVWQMGLDLDLSHYNIFKGESVRGEFVKINKGPIPLDNPKFSDEAVEAGKQYFYRVSAVDKAGNESEQSSAISGTPRDTTPPAPPEKLSVEVKERKAYLSWVAPKDKDLLGFYVYRGTNEKELMRLVGVPVKKEETKFEDKGIAAKGLVAGKTYYYGVSSTDGAYNESKKTLVEVKVPDDEPPLTPISIYAQTTEDGKVEVHWQVSMSMDLAKYRVYRRAEAEKEASVIAEVGKEVISYLDKEVEKGKKYFYQVSAVDASGNESKKTSQFAVIVRDISAPPTPEDVKVVLTKEGVLITWKKVDVDDLAGYNIYRSSLPTGIFEKLNAQPLKETSFQDKKGKKELYYKVTALDTSGNESKPSAPQKPIEGKKK